MNSILKKIWISTAILIIAAAVFSSIFRSLTPWAKQYKSEVEHHLSLILGQPVTVQTMETGWYWFQPVLKLKQVEINNGEIKSLHMDKLLVGINLFKSLWNWRIQPGILYIDDLHLIIREKDGHWNVDGMPASTLKDNELSLDNTQRILVWLSQQERLIIKHVSVFFHFSDGGLIPVNALNLSIINQGGVYSLNGDARLKQTNTTFFKLLGKVHFDPFHPENTQGQFYFSAKHIVPAQLQRLLPKSSAQLDGGKGDISLWVDLNKGLIASVQGHLKFKHLAWHLINNNNSQIIQNFYANLAWKAEPYGWQFNADHIKLRAGGITWPENQLLIKFNKDQERYQLFVKSIIVESLLAQTISWPPIIENILQIKPHGLLSDTQLFITEDKLNYVLTRFEHLTWNAQNNIPQVQNLSGVLHWQPEEGQLELDSEKTLIALKGYPVQNFDLLNGAFDWKELSNGLRVSIDRFVLSQPELTISAQGALDEVTLSSVGNIRLATEFSAKNVHQWLPLLPQHPFKAKLYHWLTKDIKQIGEASGKILVNGFVNDFPFDNQNGEFSVTSHFSGGSLLINSKWQPIDEIEGYIRVKNRDFTLDVVNADVQGVPVKQMNVRINDIGHDKEALLIHGIINAPAQKIMNYILASPLKEKLSALNMLYLKGLVLLNLRVEFPLYPENDETLVKGDLTFKDNTFLFKHQLKSLPIENVSGSVAFDEKGINQSALMASACGYPLDVTVNSIKTPKPLTYVQVDGKCSVEALQNQFDIPALTFLEGALFIKAIFKITDDPDALVSLDLKTSLVGLAINLPAPLGKIRDNIAPLEVMVNLNSKKALRIKTNYNSRLSADILLQDNKSGFEITSGQISLGNAQALNQNKPGLALVGLLDGFNLHEWSRVVNKFSSRQTEDGLLSHLRRINVKVNKVTFLKEQFDALRFNAKRLSETAWSFNLNQKKVAADLTYNSSTNTLSGFMNYLHLDKISTEGEPSLKINPGQIPNLNLRIDNVSVGELQVGNITFKSQSGPERMLISYCKIDSPVYQFNITGDWTQKGVTNQTKMKLKLHLNDLAKSLELWHITPAVDAGKGDVAFNGGWKGAIYDFSLASLTGNMNIELKNGRITHLSPETEEKLGLGKLLSVLSLQTIPRRLKLDFSDLSHQGYSFDIFKGTFIVNKGIMNTQDSYIDGPVAYAGMKGNLDLVRRLYDLDLRISPHVTASLPIVATIAGGPVIGLAAWVANKIINQGMQKISAYSYKITGPWKDPIVQQLAMVRKLVKK